MNTTKEKLQISSFVKYIIVLCSVLYIIRIKRVEEFSINLAVLAGALLIVAYNLKNQKLSSKDKRFIGVFSMLYAITVLLSKSIIFNNLCDGSYIDNYWIKPEMFDVVSVVPITIIVYIVMKFIAVVIDNIQIEISTSDKKATKIWLVSTLIIMLFWTPHLLAYYPGVIIGDSIASIAQSVGAMELWNHFPVVYTLFIKACLKVGIMLGSINLGVFIYTFIQFVVMALCAGRVVMWLYRHNVKREIYIVVMMFYAICGIFAGYAVSMWKDPLFAAISVMMSLLLLDVVFSEGEALFDTKFILMYMLIGFFLIFWRNNGLHIFLAISVVVLLVFFKKNVKRFVGGVMIVTVISIVITGPVYDVLGIRKDTITESFAVPIQQIAAVVVEDKPLTKEQQEVIFSILPKEDWHSYTPALVDRIKFHGNFRGDYLQEHSGEFLKVWAQLLIPNFRIYVRSYLYETMGFWRAGIQNGAGYFYSPGVTENEFGIYRTNILEKITGNTFERELDFSRYFICSGTLVWIMLSIIVLLILQKKKKYILVMTPAIFTWGTLMLATPIAFSIRYIFVLAFGLPVYLLLPIFKNNNIEKESFNEQKINQYNSVIDCLHHCMRIVWQ